jgi:DNA-binding response OmpR family regulator
LNYPELSPIFAPTKSISHMRVLLCGLGSVLTNALDYRLRKYGYQSLRAGTASEALGRVHAEHADALVVSVNVEDYKLATFIALIREDFRSRIPIILVTEPDADPETVLAGLEAGADDFVTFPFKPNELVLRLKLRLHDPIFR